MTKKSETIIFPSKVGSGQAVFIINLPYPMASSARNYLRSIGRDSIPHLFHAPIKCSIYGKSPDGHPIAVKTVGRWLFGVPGFKGFARVTLWPTPDVARVKFPADSPQIVYDLIQAIKQHVESITYDESMYRESAIDYWCQFGVRRVDPQSAG